MPAQQHPLPDPIAPRDGPTLIVKYALIATYGAASGLVGVTTLDVTYGFVWSLLWPLLVMAAAVAAIVGVTFSMRGRGHSAEIVATMCLLVLLASYSIAIIVRTVGDHDVERLPVALLPIILSVYPFSHLLRIVQRGSAR